MKSNEEQLINQIETELRSANWPNSKIFNIGLLIEQFRAEQNKPKEFINWVCELSGCTTDELKTKVRKIEIVQARQLITVGLVHIFDMTTLDAGNEINKDHTHYYWSFKTVKNYCDTSKEYRNKFADIFIKHPEMLIKKKMLKYVF